jgi:hypothetical protein
MARNGGAEKGEKARKEDRAVLVERLEMVEHHIVKSAE